jgi:hypothetical protein
MLASPDESESVGNCWIPLRIALRICGLRLLAENSAKDEVRRIRRFGFVEPKRKALPSLRPRG